MSQVNRHRNSLTGLTLPASVVAPLQAALAGPSHCWPSPHREHYHNVGQHFQHRQEHLKNDLHLKQDQIAAWQNFTVAADARAEQNAASAHNHSQPLKTAPKRLQARIDFMQNRLKSMRKMQAALKQLYAKLSPTQQTILDLELRPDHHWHHWL